MAGMAPGVAPDESIRVYADGVFDLFHAGHLSFLRKAREVGGSNVTLIVGVMTDEAAGWKRRPIIPHAQRLEMLRNCRLVDEVVEEPPLVLTGDFLDQHKIMRVVHGDDDLQEEFFHVPRERKIMVYVPYAREGVMAVSTSKIIARVRERTDADDCAQKRADSEREKRRWLEAFTGAPP